MKRLAYLLLLLLISAEADGAWAAAPVLPSAPLSDDNDEYLPAQALRQLQGAAPAPRQPQAFNGRKPRTANSFPVRGGVSSGWDGATPFGPPPLYVFMSLQI